jgi:hypothetical protein
MKGAAQVVERQHRDPTRGEVYWFLWDEHDSIMKRTAGRRMSWKTMLADIQALGLTNGAGRPLDSVETLRSTFATVRRDKKRETEVKQQKAAASRRVTNTPPPMVSLGTGSPIRPLTPLASETGTRTPEEQIAWIRDEIMKRSGKRGR